MSTASGNSKLDSKKLAGRSRQAYGGYTITLEEAIRADVLSTARQIPDWLKADLFVDVLRKNVPDFKAIKSFSAKIAQDAGESTITLMSLVEMDVELENGTSKEVSYMIRLPIEMMQRVMTKGFDALTIESAVYRDIIPELEQLYSDAGVEVKFAPKYYDIETLSEHGVILMEDLRQRGFKNANRLEGFDIEHTKSALKKLAQWHAATAVRVANKGKYPQNIATGILTKEFIESMKVNNAPSAKLYAECVRTYKGHEVYIDSLIKAQEKIFDGMEVFLNPDPNEFNVLNHGDFWGNNIIFQYDEFGKIKETLFMDFHGTCYGPPIEDLYSILLSSTQYEIKLKHFEYFIQYYHNNLIECLNLLKCPKKMPSLKEIHMQLYKYGISGLGVVSGQMGSVLLDPTDSANFDNLLGNIPGSLKSKWVMFTNKRYRKHAEAVLPWLHKRGAFEY